MLRNRTYLLVAFLVTLAPFAMAQKGKKKKHPPAAATATPEAPATAAPSTSTAPSSSAPTTAPSSTSATSAAAPVDGEKKEEEKDDSDVRPPTALALQPAFILPVGDHTDVTRTGFGLNLDAEHRISPTIRLSARTGFHYHLDAKNFEVLGTNAAVTSRRVHAVPVLVGARYFPGQTGWYVNAETGLFIRFDSKEAEVKNTGRVEETSSVKFNLGFGIGGGYQFGRCDLRAALHDYDVTHLADRLAFSVSFGYKFWESGDPKAK